MAARGVLKYRNVRVTDADGTAFDSKREQRHRLTLESLRRASDAAQRVTGYRMQVSYDLVPKQPGRIRNERPVRYKADFVVIYADGHEEVHDCKSPATRTKDYIIKRKLMKLIHGIEIVEI